MASDTMGTRPYRYLGRKTRDRDTHSNKSDSEGVMDAMIRWNKGQIHRGAFIPGL